MAMIRQPMIDAYWRGIFFFRFFFFERFALDLSTRMRMLHFFLPHQSLI